MAVKTGAQDPGGTPTTRPAGIAGILAALALAGEFLFFSLSGFQQASFSNPASAIAFLRDHGGLVRVAVVFGAAGVALTLLFLSGLAERLRSRAPLLSAATLYFGVVGNVGDGLVALSFWIGIPIFVGLAGHESGAAQSAWPAFFALTGGYQGFGNLFAGLSLLATGWAAVSQGVLPRVLGAIALGAGISAMASVLIANAQIGFILALLLVIVFRVWAGIELYRGERAAAGTRGRTAGQVSAGSPTTAE